MSATRAGIPCDSRLTTPQSRSGGESAVVTHELRFGEQAATHLHAVFGNSHSPDALISIFTLPDKRTSFHATVANAASDAIERAKVSDVYFGLGLRRPGCSGRGGGRDVVGIPAFAVDVDFGPQHVSKRYPPSEADALRLIDSLSPEPSLIVHSGNGFHAYWLFDRVWVFASEAERAKAASAAKVWNQHVQRVASGFDWSVDSTHDLPRVYRVAGTFNRKTDPPTPVVLHSLSGLRYPRADLLAQANASTPATKPSGNGQTASLQETFKQPSSAADAFQANLTDAEIIAIASHARNGDKFKRLCSGDTNGYPSASEADLGLCNFLAFYTHADGSRMDSLFRQSGLMRDKWDSRRADSTYGRDTIAKAIAGTTTFYDPTRRSGRNGEHRTDAAEQPRFDMGVAEITLECLEARSTPTRRAATFAIRVGCKEAGCVDCTSTATGIGKAVREIADAFEEATLRTLEREDRRRLEKRLRKIMELRSVRRMAAALQSIEAPDGEQSDKATMLEAVRAIVADTLRPAFKSDDGTLWSERDGRGFKQWEFSASVPSEAVAAIPQCRDYVEPERRDPLKPFRCVKQIMPTIWSDLLRTLPTEVRADALGPESKAAKAFRQRLIEIFTACETWFHFDDRGGRERISIATAIIESASPDRGGWYRPLRSVPVWSRLTDGVRWIAIRDTLLNGRIVQRCRVPNIQSFRDLATLARRYGLTHDGGTPSARLDTGTRLVVLSRDLTREILLAVDDVSTVEEADE